MGKFGTIRDQRVCPESMTTRGEIVGERLVGIDPLKELLNTFLSKWDEDTSSSTLVRSYYTMYDLSMGPHVETYEAIHTFILNLLQCPPPGIKILVLLTVTKSGIVELLHSLFYVPVG